MIGQRFHTRRRLLQIGAGALLGSTIVRAAESLVTPAQTAGPFYPRELPLDSDNDLTRVNGQAERARGVICELHGRLLAQGGDPVEATRIEIWQCDATGQYHHPRDRIREPRDMAFQGFGSTTTDHEGRYRFRTIRPVPYPGRTPHIHMRVVGDEVETLTTQLYIAGHPGNAEDGIFRRLGDAGQRAASASFVPAEDADVEEYARFDIVLA